MLSPSAHFIDHVLQPLARSYIHRLPTKLYTATKSLQDWHVHVPDDAFLVSIDVDSLYVYIPLVLKQNASILFTTKCMNENIYLILCDPKL